MSKQMQVALMVALGILLVMFQLGEGRRAGEPATGHDPQPPAPPPAPVPAPQPPRKRGRPRKAPKVPEPTPEPSNEPAGAGTSATE